MACKGLCERLAVKKPRNNQRYAAGQRPCSLCGVFFDTNGLEVLRCPCCNTKLRMTQRNKSRL